MKRFEITVEIQAAAQKAWAVLLDVERWPEWTASMQRVTLLDGGPLRVGSRARVEQPGLPAAVWQVTELDGAVRSFTWTSRGPGLQVAGLHRVEEFGRHCKVTLAIEISGLLSALVARPLRGLNQKYLGFEAAGLRERCEA